jgi:hypothetical protein
MNELADALEGLLQEAKRRALEINGYSSVDKVGEALALLATYQDEPLREALVKIFEMGNKPEMDPMSAICQASRIAENALSTLTAQPPQQGIVQINGRTMTCRECGGAWRPTEPERYWQGCSKLPTQPPEGCPSCHGIDIEYMPRCKNCGEHLDPINPPDDPVCSDCKDTGNIPVFGEDGIQIGESACLCMQRPDPAVAGPSPDYKQSHYHDTSAPTPRAEPTYDIPLNATLIASARAEKAEAERDALKGQRDALEGALNAYMIKDPSDKRGVSESEESEEYKKAMDALYPAIAKESGEGAKE